MVCANLQESVAILWPILKLKVIGIQHDIARKLGKLMILHTNGCKFWIKVCCMFTVFLFWLRICSLKYLNRPEEISSWVFILSSWVITLHSFRICSASRNLNSASSKVHKSRTFSVYLCWTDTTLYEISRKGYLSVRRKAPPCVRYTFRRHRRVSVFSPPLEEADRKFRISLARAECFWACSPQPRGTKNSALLSLKRMQ